MLDFICKLLVRVTTSTLRYLGLIKNKLGIHDRPTGKFLVYNLDKESETHCIS